jgi:hypothetical protein
VAAEHIIGEIEAVQGALGQAGDEPSRRLGFRLEHRVRGHPHCGADWGCCPEHGATLTSAGGRCWCRIPRCGRIWGRDRLRLPCDEPPAFRVVDAEGGDGLLCAGRAIAARRQMIGARLLPLQGQEEER